MDLLAGVGMVRDSQTPWIAGRSSCIMQASKRGDLFLDDGKHALSATMHRPSVSDGGCCFGTRV